MAKKGLRFFGTDYNSNVFGGTVTASTGTTGSFAFDGLIGTRWLTSGEGTDGNSVSLEVAYGLSRTVDAFYVYNTNIEDIEIQYWNGSTWVTVDTSNATIAKSTDLKYVFAKLNAPVNTEKVRIIGDDTITANQEKYVTLFMAFAEIGQFEYFPDFRPSIEPEQNVFTTTDGRGFVIEKGEAFSAKLEFKSHVNQNDIDLIEQLLARKEPFFIWPNGGDSSIFRYSFRPYRFKDIFKVTIIGKNDPRYTKNYYKAGYNNSVSLIEVT